MWPDDCWRLDWLKKEANRAFFRGDEFAGAQLVMRMMGACEALGVNVEDVQSSAQVEQRVQRAKDRLNKKWVPQA